MPPELTVRECVELYAGYYPHPRAVRETIELVGLTEKRGARASQLSGGQRRRLDVALALIGDPELVFLDEPTTGFDPSARHHAWEVIADLRELGKTIFLTTHYMDEAETARRPGRRDRAPARSSPRARRDARWPRPRLSEISFTLPAGQSVAELPGELAAGAPSGRDGRVHQLSAADPARSLHVLTGWALDHGDELRDLTVGRPTLEDVYLRLTDGQEHPE